MEEKKLTPQKKAAKKAVPQQQKLTYEQLNDACTQLYQQNQELIRRIRQIDATNMFKRLDYLFLVLQNASTIKDADFINSCIDEIKEAMSIKEDTEGQPAESN